MKDINEEIREKLEILLLTIETGAGGKIGKLEQDGLGAYIITYQDDKDKGLAGAQQLLSNLEAGGFLRTSLLKKAISKIKKSLTDDDIKNMVEHNPNFKIDFGKNSTSIFFKPYDNYENVISGLDQAIGKANRAPEYKESEKRGVTNPTVIKLPANAEAVSTYLTEKVRAILPDNNVKVIYSNANVHSNHQFLVIIDKETIETSLKVQKLVNELKDIFSNDINPEPVSKIHFFRADKANSEIQFNVSGNPVRLLLDIRDNDPENFHDITKKHTFAKI